MSMFTVVHITIGFFVAFFVCFTTIMFGFANSVDRVDAIRWKPRQFIETVSFILLLGCLFFVFLQGFTMGMMGYSGNMLDVPGVEHALTVMLAGTWFLGIWFSCVIIDAVVLASKKRQQRAHERAMVAIPATSTNGIM